MFKRRYLIMGVINVLLIGHINTYSYMVPQESCFSMYPNHNNSRQQTSPPYGIIIHKNSYAAFEKIKITLHGIDRMQFSGFMLQARLYRTQNIVGSWTYDTISNEQTVNEFIGTIKCLDNNNTLVHAWPEFYKEKGKFFTNISAYWIAPAFDNTNIEFIATVVYKYDKFWTDIRSVVLTPTKNLQKNSSKNNKLLKIGLLIVVNVLISIQFRHFF